MTQRSSLTGHHQPLLPLVQVRQHRLELRPQRLHQTRLDSDDHIMTDQISNGVAIYRQALTWTNPSYRRRHTALL